jgi:hypothetical protein
METTKTHEEQLLGPDEARVYSLWSVCWFVVVRESRAGMWLPLVEN